MTHDELLARVTNQAGWTDNHVNDRITVVVSDWNAGWNARDNTNALRVVVELHKPVQSYMFEEEACSHCSSEEDRSEILYPCPTIQAIEKELG